MFLIFTFHFVAFAARSIFELFKFIRRNHLTFGFERVFLISVGEKQQCPNLLSCLFDLFPAVT